MRKKNLCCYLLIALMVLLPNMTEACTLWAANGEAVQGGGSMIVKVRDWAPDHRQELKLFTPTTGYRYYGLVAVDGKYPGLKAGINEKGLVVVTATAGSIPNSERRAMPSTRGIMSTMLKQCASVDEALTLGDLFWGPQYIMLADKDKIAVIEIGPEGKSAVDVRQNDKLYHTNHYVLGDMLEHNRKIGDSSLTRYQRIRELLKDERTPYSLNNFLLMSNDCNDGPDNSIFRTGSTPDKTRTLAIWAVIIPPQSTPELQVRILNPGEEEQIVKLTLKEIFKMR